MLAIIAYLMCACLSACVGVCVCVSVCVCVCARLSVHVMLRKHTAYHRLYNCSILLDHHIKSSQFKTIATLNNGKSEIGNLKATKHRLNIYCKI